MRTLIFLSVFLLPVRLPAQEPAEAAPPNHVFHTALEWMSSSNPERREAAYRSVHLFGEESLPAFEKALHAAVRNHAKRLAAVLEDRDNPYRDLGGVADELKSERGRVNALIHTDWHKEPDKIRALRTEFAGVERLYEEAVQLSESDLVEIDRRVDAIATALAELNREIARFNVDADAHDDVTAETPLDELKRLALRETFDGDLHLTDKAHLAAMKDEVERLATATAENEACGWANGAQKAFAVRLNHERAVMGMNPLRIEERLSAAATGHSKDMRSHGFFSHTSPVEGKRTPADRARRAEFKGGWTGENIYMGSAAPDAAYDAWFGSDGHRFIMFAKRPNLLGIGPVGTHWTLMTGRK